MRIVFVVLNCWISITHAQISPAREAARRTAVGIHAAIRKDHPTLRRAIVGSSSCNPATGRIRGPDDPKESLVPCVVLYCESDEMASRLKAVFGSSRDGVPVVYDSRSPGPAVAFGNFGSGEVDVKMAQQALDAIYERPGVTSVGLGDGLTISVADGEAERDLLAKFPPHSTLFGLPVVIERGQTFDARDPRVDPPCEPELANTGWSRLKRRVKKFFRRPVR